jgi:hypothetical protein
MIEAKHLAQQQQAGGIQRRWLDHQAEVLDHEFGHCFMECIQRRNARQLAASHRFSSPVVVQPRRPHMPQTERGDI